MGLPRGAGGLLPGKDRWQQAAMRKAIGSRKNDRMARHELIATWPAAPGNEGPDQPPGMKWRQCLPHEKARANSRYIARDSPSRKGASPIRTDLSWFADIRRRSFSWSLPQMSVASTL